MKHALEQTISRWPSAALWKGALATGAVVTCICLVGCGSHSTDTATATALFRQIVKHQYDVTAGRCSGTTSKRWTCTARINDPAKEIDVDFRATVWRDDGQWSATGSQEILGALRPGS